MLMFRPAIRAVAWRLEFSVFCEVEPDGLIVKKANNTEKNTQPKIRRKDMAPSFYVDDQGNGELALLNMDEFPPKPPKGQNPNIAPFPKKKIFAF
jgi:hypothetical protein